MQNGFESVIRMARLLETERARLAERGPNYSITHRGGVSDDCLPGETIEHVEFLHRSRRILVRLSLRLLLLFDYLSRHRRPGQNSGQIAAGLNGDPFTQRHGANEKAGRSLRRRFSRNGVREQIRCLRIALGLAFRDAGLNLDPKRVLVAKKTTTNEVLYQLKASVSWRHVKINAGQ